DIESAPHGPEVLERYPQVAVLKKKSRPEREVPKYLGRVLSRFPILRRHPHPMTIHFPIVFMFSTTLFNILYLLTGIRSFEVTALHCLGAGILLTPVAMATGYLTWWLNYLARPIPAVAIKKKTSVILFGTEIIAFLWRVTVPDILQTFSPAGLIYALLIFSLLPLVSVIGWFGAQLTFPPERD
ncbi:MAG: cytochrome b5, partial [Deltaproteobacteria bacterium]|nr:cytochrome b5 [Deltaproteobacteria bacterium]